ncbi:uncharacterized protein LOC144542736 [Centroberyx gerrardi]
MNSSSSQFTSPKATKDMKKSALTLWLISFSSPSSSCCGLAVSVSLLWFRSCSGPDEKAKPPDLCWLLNQPVTEQKDSYNLTLSCSVVTYECRETLMWLYDGVKLDGNIRNIQISQSPCNTTVSFLTFENIKERFQCEVTDYSGKQTFDFTSLSSDSSVLNYVMLALRVAELFLITVITALLIRSWRRARGFKLSKRPCSEPVWSSSQSGRVSPSSPVTEQKDNYNLTLSCSVVTYGECRQTLRWLYEGKKVNRNTRNILISQSPCHTTVSFLSYHYNKERFKCEVTDGRSGKLQTFDFIPLSSGTKAKTTTTKSTIATTTKETGPTTNSTTNSNPQDWWPIVVGLAAVIIIVLIISLIICWKRARGNKTPAEDNTALTPVSDANPAVKQSGPETNQDQTGQTGQTDQDDGLTYASISHSNNNEKKEKKKKKTAGKAQVPNNDGDEEDATVTYATVKTSSASAGDATDPSNLYATVNKPRK